MTEPTAYVTKNALLSVYTKDGIVEFAQKLIKLGWKVWASGGTAKVLRKAGLEAHDVAEMVGEAILGHRVVTLSREVHAALLARPIDVDLKVLEELGLPFIDLVCCDFYPLAEAIAKLDATVESVIESTDIGGPTMVRSAAKGGRIVVVDPADRNWVLYRLGAGGVSPEMRQKLAAKAELIVSQYVFASAQFLSGGFYYAAFGSKVADCKYGENQCQTPAIHYTTSSNDPLALDRFDLLAGTSPSFNNLGDIDRGLQTITHIAAGWRKNFGCTPAIAVGIKHGNACGAGVAETPIEAVRRMVEGDPGALFGGVVIVNFPIDAVAAGHLRNHQTAQAGKLRILDTVIAPEITPAAIEILGRKDGKCRMLVNSKLAELDETTLDQGDRIKYVRGGYLVQPNYSFVLDLQSADVRQVGNTKVLTDQEKKDLVLGWAVGSTSNSNTITITDDGKLLANGVGQQHRAAAARLALDRAGAIGHDLAGAKAYSDSFFPFRDGLDILAKAGVSAILASCDSRKDPEVEAAATEHGVALVWIPDAIGRGFYGH